MYLPIKCIIVTQHKYVQCNNSLLTSHIMGKKDFLFLNVPKRIRHNQHNINYNNY